MRKKVYRFLKKIAGRDYIDACDEYINWLLVSNAGMQEKGNIFCFETAIRNLPTNDPVIEIGAHAGLSANIMTYLLAKHNKQNKVISVDPWIVRGYHDEQSNVTAEYMKTVGNNKEVTRADYSAFIRKSYIDNTAFFSSGNLPFAFQATSDTFFDWWKNNETKTDIRQNNLKLGGPVSFVFIDGNHDYDFAKRDFENSDRWLVKGGYILFDNSENDSPFGSALFAKELEKNKNYQLVCANPNRLFLKK